MAKRKFKLTDEEQKELLKAYQASKDTGTRTRYQAVRLYGEGYAEKEIGADHWLSSNEFDGMVSSLPSRSIARIGGSPNWWQQRQIEQVGRRTHCYLPKMQGIQAWP